MANPPRPALSPDRPDVSLVIPVFNEAGAAVPLAREIATAFTGWRYEMVFVDDASTDATLALLKAAQSALPALRIVSHGANAGQSRAVRSGVQAARAPLVVTLDGDGQNDPADAPRLVRRLMAGGPELALVGGRRVFRRDSTTKSWASRLANGLRRRLLKDFARDTGCGLKAFRRDAFLALPYFDHMHRYLPALMIREGHALAFEDVRHRPRTVGASNYTNLGRLGDAATDILGVMWLASRGRSPGRLRHLDSPAADVAKMAHSARVAESRETGARALH